MQCRICQGVDVEEKEKAQKTYLKPSGRFYKALIDKFLSFSCFYLCSRRRTLLKGYSPSLLSDTIWKAGFLLYRPKIMAYGALMEVLQLNKHFNLQRILIGVRWM